MVSISKSRHALRNTFDPSCLVHRAARLNAIVHDQKQHHPTILMMMMMMMMMMILPQRSSRDRCRNRERETEREIIWMESKHTWDHTQCARTKSWRGLMRRVAMRVVTSLPANQKPSTLRSETVLVQVKATFTRGVHRRPSLDSWTLIERGSSSTRKKREPSSCTVLH